MSITLDVNLLLYASDESSPYHSQATRHLARLAAGPRLVYLFWPTIMAYLRIATHPAVFEHPLSADQAVDNIDRLLNRPHVRTTSEQESFWSTYRRLAQDVSARGNLVPDTHLAALMAENGVRTIWTRDRDFRKFREIEAVDPFE